MLAPDVLYDNYVFIYKIQSTNNPISNNKYCADTALSFI